MSILSKDEYSIIDRILKETDSRADELLAWAEAGISNNYPCHRTLYLGKYNITVYLFPSKFDYKILIPVIRSTHVFTLWKHFQADSENIIKEYKKHYNIM